MRVSGGLLAAAVLLLAAGLRLQDAAARDCLHGDEVQGVEIVRASKDVPALLGLLHGEGHPPLPYILDLAASREGLASIDDQRSLRLACGLLAVALLMFIVARTIGVRAAIPAGLLMAASPYFVQSSVELRSYAYFTLLGLVHLGCVILHVQRGRTWTAALWGTVAGLLCGVHYYAIHQIVPAGLYVLARDRSRAGILRVALAALCCVVTFAPWMAVFLSTAGSDIVANWFHYEVALSQIALFARVSLGFIVGQAILAWGLAHAWFGVREPGTPERTKTAVEASIAVSLGGTLSAWLVHLYQGPYEARYLCASAAAALVPLGYALARTNRVGVGLLALCLVSQQMDRNAWSRRPSDAALVAARIEAELQPGDVVWAFPDWPATTLRFHLEDGIPVRVPAFVDSPRWVDIPGRWERFNDPAVGDAAVRELRDTIRRGNRVWFVTNHWPIDAASVANRGLGIPHGETLHRPAMRRCWRLMRVLQENGVRRQVHEGSYDESRQALDVVLFEPDEGSR